MSLWQAFYPTLLRKQASPGPVLLLWFSSVPLTDKFFFNLGEALFLLLQQWFPWEVSHALLS